MLVTVPSGSSPGDVLQCSTPEGLVEVTIPSGFNAGSTFEIIVPRQSSSSPVPSVPAPAPSPMPASLPTHAAYDSADELKARLVTLVNRLPERGRAALLVDQQPWELLAIAAAIDALQSLDPASARDGWMYEKAWGGSTGAAAWVLRFTSSRSFHLNEGLTGYACRWPEVSTPELRMWVDQPRRDCLLLEEPIVRGDGGGAVAKPEDACIAECVWRIGPADSLRIEVQTFRADGRQWSPRDPNQGDEVDMAAEKAPRVLAQTTPVYLDDSLLVLRSAVVPDVVFVWTRMGAADLPTVDVEADAAVWEAAAREAASAARQVGNRIPRPANREIIPKYN